MSRYAKLSAWLIGAWFLVTLIASGLHLYRVRPGQPPAVFGLAVLVPLVVFAVWLARSVSFREFAMSLNPRVLTYVQSLRLEGFVFLVLATYGILPRAFALSAGWGDIAIGATASLVALKLATPARRWSFIVWQVLGIVDLVNAIAMGTLSGVVNPHGIPTDPMTVLPMSLIPTFGVPLFLMLHVICIGQALRWPKQQVRSAAPQRLSEAL